MTHSSGAIRVSSIQCMLAVGREHDKHDRELFDFRWHYLPRFDLHIVSGIVVVTLPVPLGCDRAFLCTCFKLK